MKPVVAAYSDDVRSAIRGVISILSGGGSVVVYLCMIVITLEEREREREDWKVFSAGTSWFHVRGYGIAGANRGSFSSRVLIRVDKVRQPISCRCDAKREISTARGCRNGENLVFDSVKSVVNRAGGYCRIIIRLGSM